MPPTPKFIYWSADPQEVQNFSLFGGENFKEVIKLNETIRISPNPKWLASLEKRMVEDTIFFFFLI